MSKKNNLPKESVPSVIMGATLKKYPGQKFQQKTDISGLDEILDGGLPKYTLTLLAGTSGTGKTVLGFQWLFNGAKQDENGVYISITEPLSMAVRNVESMGFYDRKAIEQEKLRLFDIKEDLKYEKIDPNLILRYIEKQVKENNAKRLVIDSITAILCALNAQVKITHFMFELKKLLGTLGCTTFLLSKVTEEKKYSAYGIEELVSDGVISLSSVIGENQMIRHFEIIKMRGINFRSGAVTYDITPSGIILYPKIPIDRSVAVTEFKNRVTSGMKELDTLCGNGFPQGHVIMVAGNTGSGKTTFGIQFLVAGLKKGENGIYVALEESSSQIKKTAFAHGWDLEKYEKNGNLVFINPDLIDVNTNKFLYQLVDYVAKTGTKRVVVDSISSLESATMNRPKVREFLIQLSGYLKTKGTTTMLTYLSEEVFGAESGQLMGGGMSSELRLSSIVDGIILLRYVERKQSVAKLLTILKMRGSAHDKRIWKFEIGKAGVNIGGGTFKK